MDRGLAGPDCEPGQGRKPHIKVIIKFPNWYESFQGNGYDLQNEPNYFDGSGPATETRDPTLTPLSICSSMRAMKFFVTLRTLIRKNGGGWVDTGVGPLH